MLLGILNSQVTGGAAGAYDLLETQVLSSSAASVTFTGLGSYTDYKHLQIRATLKTNSGSANAIPFLRFNGSSTGYADHAIYGTGSAVSTDNDTSASQIYWSRLVGSASDANEFSPLICDILDFSSSVKNTTTRTMAGATSGTKRIWFSSGLWNNTSAVTSLTITESGGASYVAGCRLSLYGVR